MAKRSQRRPVRSEREQFGCMGGLISMFDFRPSRTTQRLLSDRRRGNKHAYGAGNQGDKHDTLYPSDTCQGSLDNGEETTVTDSCKPSMKKLIEEEMSTEQDTKIENAEVESKQCDSGHGDNRRKSHRRTKKSRKKSYDDIHDVDAAEKVGSEGPCLHKPEHQAISSLDIKNVMEELCRQIHQKNVNCVKLEQPGELHMEPDKKSPGFEEKLGEAIKFLVSQKLTDGNVHVDDGELRTSKDLTEALQILSADEELFLKLLRDPNSLLVRYVQDLPDAEAKKEESRSLAGCDISKEELANPTQSDELVNRKHHNFFRRKVKPRGRDSSNGSNFSQTSNKIVILKPGPAALQNPESGSSLVPSTESHYVVRSNIEQNEKVSSHFFLSEIKRKLKHAIGMEQQRTAVDGISKRYSVEHQNAGRSRGVKEYAGMNSPTKDHFFIERTARTSTGRLKDCEINIEHETADFSKQKVSSIYIEAKKHLSEMLNNGEQNADCSSHQAQKTLGSILSLSDYNSSPVGSPGRNEELSSVTAQGVAACDASQLVNENMQHNHVSRLSQSSENSETQPHISDDLNNSEVQDHNLNLSIPEQYCDDNRVEEASCSIGDQMSSRDAVKILKVAETLVQEESNLLDTFPETSTSCDTTDDKTVDISDACAEKQDPKFSKQKCEDDQLSSSPLASPPHSSVTMKVEYSDKITDIQERPSPVSVLEPFFIEDVISPAGTRSHSAETAIQPLRIQFEEYDSSAANQGNHTKACMDDKESVFEYIKVVLQASSLNWDELYIKSLSSDLLLDPNLIGEVELYPNQHCHDQKLLFDCVNEVLMEVCGHYFGCSPWVSFIKPSIRPIPNMNITIQEVFNGVYWHLLSMPLPRTLDQIVRKDMAKTGTWLDLRVETESIGVEMGEAILEDLLEDIIMSCTTANSEPTPSAVLA